MKTANRANCKSFYLLFFVALIAVWSTACGGAPESFQDGVGAVSEGNAVGERPDAGDRLVVGDAQGDAMAPKPTAACTVISEGCPCYEEGESMECKTPKITIGDYTTCASGKRVCKAGTWGPCVGKIVYQGSR